MNTSNEDLEIIEEVVLDNLGVYVTNDSINDTDSGTENVRKTGFFRDSEYQEKYDNREDYNSSKYHSHKNYINTNKEIKSLREKGILKDGYIGKRVNPNERTDLDHILGAKRIHEDKAVYLANSSTVDLANRSENLTPTDPHLNRAKKDKSFEETILKKHSDEYTEREKIKMLEKERNTKDSYNKTISNEYLNSAKFKVNLVNQSINLDKDFGIRTAVSRALVKLIRCIKENNKKDVWGFIESIFEGLYRGITKVFSEIKNILKEL